MAFNAEFWKDKKVLLTGHTGFKGSWLTIWLNQMGAKVVGYSLQPPTDPSLFGLAGVDKLCKSVIADVRDLEKLSKVVLEEDPDILIHMAAQPLVRDSYKIPVDTYAINVMGTVHVLESARQLHVQKNGKQRLRAVVNVTTDKCYENKEWLWGYRENEPMGGYDPYSNSKGCSELVTSAYRNSYFSPAQHGVQHHLGIASGRAGNVIGGGDWANDRLIPDFIRAILEERRVLIRSPHAIRPWQHVLEPLCGYLTLAQKVYENGKEFSEGWNFGPEDSDAKPVQWIIERLCSSWGGKAGFDLDKRPQPHEAQYLKLDCSKAKAKLGWAPRWSLGQALEAIVEWTRAYQRKDNLHQMCVKQIDTYMKTC